MIALTYLLVLVLALVFLALVRVAYQRHAQCKETAGEPPLLEMSMDEIIRREG